MKLDMKSVIVPRVGSEEHRSVATDLANLRALMAGPPVSVQIGSGTVITAYVEEIQHSPLTPLVFSPNGLVLDGVTLVKLKEPA